MKKTSKALLQDIQKIPGWLSQDEGLFLLKMVQKVPQGGRVVEIGSWKGKSTVLLSRGLKNNKGAKLYSIDPHLGSPERKKEYGKVNTFPDFLENIQKYAVKENVIPLRKTSLSAAKQFQKKIDLLFVDGSHVFEDVLQDLKSWLPKLKNGGVIIIHDATVLPGPWKAAKREIIFSDNFERVGMLGSMVFAQKRNPESFGQRTKVKLKNFLSYLFIISYVKLRKVPFPQRWKRVVSRLNLREKIRK